MEINEFKETYWNHYLFLEQDFINTLRYLELDDINKDAFSEEYFKQLQSICSEVDVFCKIYCNILDKKIKCKNIGHYCKVINDNDKYFINNEIWVYKLKRCIKPWDNWIYETKKDKKGIDRIESINPEWWGIYNKSKHTRTACINVSGNKVEYYKLANQKNVLSALAALYCLEMSCYLFLLNGKLLEKYDLSKLAIKKSKLFHFRQLIGISENANLSKFLWYEKQIGIYLLD